MLCLGLSLSPSPFSGFSHPIKSGWRRDRIFSSPRWRLMSQESDSSFAPSLDSDITDITSSATAGFCIIEGPETVQDFAKMELQEIQDNIRSRRNKIFLHMEEVRRLRIQQRIKSAELGILEEEQENELPNFPSFIPFLPPLTSANLKQYYATCFSLISGIILFGGLLAPSTSANLKQYCATCFSLISGIILFGGLLAPSMELKLGLGGTSYADFVESEHLPMLLRLWRMTSMKSEKGSDDDSGSPSKTKTGIGFGSSDKKKKKGQRERGSIIRRNPVEKPSFVSEGKVKEENKNESAFLLSWLGFGLVILVEGIALAASGFLPEQWDQFFVNFLYPSFTPTVFLFVAGAVAYGVLKYLQNENITEQK